jgi:hypothetical protein
LKRVEWKSTAGFESVAGPIHPENLTQKRKNPAHPLHPLNPCPSVFIDGSSGQSLATRPLMRMRESLQRDGCVLNSDAGFIVKSLEKPRMNTDTIRSFSLGQDEETRNIKLMKIKGHLFSLILLPFLVVTKGRAQDNENKQFSLILEDNWSPDKVNLIRDTDELSVPALNTEVIRRTTKGDTPNIATQCWTDPKTGLSWFGLKRTYYVITPSRILGIASKQSVLLSFLSQEHRAEAGETLETFGRRIAKLSEDNEDAFIGKIIRIPLGDVLGLRYCTGYPNSSLPPLYIVSVKQSDGVLILGLENYQKTPGELRLNISDLSVKSATVEGKPVANPSSADPSGR